MRKVRIAINGFGRIGRLVLRQLLKNVNAEVVAINDLTDIKTLAHLFRYDSAQGAYSGTVEADSGHLIIDGKQIAYYASKNPADLPWKNLEVDVVLECTGIFRDKEKAMMHIEAGAKRVIISAPGKGDMLTVVRGINDNLLSAEEKIVSNASCTTNCLAPVLKVILDNWGMERIFASTVHAYTADQNIQDAPHKDLRRARAAAINIVPTSTGAGDALIQIFPELKGMISTSSVRVPVITGSMVDVIAILKKIPASGAEVNAAFKSAAMNHFKGIMQYSEEPLVSSDIVGSPFSTIFDAELTTLNANMLKVSAWYDNEAGYSARLAEVATMINH
jgi:glyceraldehyde 3-phosphate dehydrogenase